MSKKTKSTTKDKSKTASRPPKKSERQLRVDFTDQETLELAKKLAEANAELKRAEDDKKAVTSQLKANCDGIASRIACLSGKINDGFEYRQVPVETVYDQPKAGMKTTTRLDTKEVVDVEAMSMGELQQELPLGAESTKMIGTNVGQVIEMASAKISRPPLRTVTGSGVVATEGDGTGEDLQDEDDSKT